MGTEQGSKVPLQKIIHEAAISFLIEEEEISEEDFFEFLKSQFRTPELERRGSGVISLPHLSARINIRLRQLAEEGKQSTEEFEVNQRALGLIRGLDAAGHALIEKEA